MVSTEVGALILFMEFVYMCGFKRTGEGVVAPECPTLVLSGPLVLVQNI